MAPTTFHKLSIICLISSAVPCATALATAISAAQALGLLQRDSSTCANSTFDRCSDSNLPSYFCCAADTTCISLASSTSALCCPEGEDCSTIEPISCNTALQNATAYPDSTVKTTKLGDSLPKCGDQCCPFGYDCQDGVCLLNTTTSSTSSSSSSSSSSTSIPASASASAASASNTQGSSTHSATSTPTITNDPSASTSTGTGTVAQHTTCEAFPGRAVAVGFFPGMIAGALVAFMAFFCLGLRKEKRPESSHSSKFSHIRERSADGALIGISEPLPSSTQQFIRTDFIRRGQPSEDDGQSRLKTRVRSFFSPGTNTAYNKNNYEIPVVPSQPALNFPSTPPNKTSYPSNDQYRPRHPAREPSTESIKVYSPETIMTKSGNNASVQQILLQVPPTQMQQQNQRHPAHGLPLNPRPPVDQRPNTTFTELMERAGLPHGQGQNPQYNINTGSPGKV